MMIDLYKDRSKKRGEMILSSLYEKGLSQPELVKRMLDFEAYLLTLPQREDIETVHHFAPGQYAREMRAPKDSFLTGEIHKTEHLVIVSSGEITILCNDGMGLKRVKAPFTFVSKPGMKRIGYTHEDTVWTTIHATNETCLDKIEEEIFDRYFVGYNQKRDMECLDSLQASPGA